MKAFDVKNLGRWEEIGPGEAVEFEARSNRKVRFLVNSSGRVSVFAEEGGRRALVGSADGLFEVAYSAEGASVVTFEAEPGVSVFVSGLARSQVVQPTSEEVFTSVLPQGRRNSEYDRMMLYMRLNEERRERQVQDEISKLRAASAEKLDRRGDPVPSDEEVTDDEERQEEAGSEEGDPTASE